MEEVLAPHSRNAAFRLFVEELVLKAVAQVFPVGSDPNYLAIGCNICSICERKTDEEQMNAQKALKSLLSSY